MGVQHINPANYHPFAPGGIRGIGQGAAIVFFAYIGFDAISTAAEETKNPQRNLPIGIMGGLAICTVIYIVVGVVLTGMVPASGLGTAADPLAYALNATGLTSISKIVSLGAVFSLSAVLLVFQYGQPRIFFGMARDGLLPAWAAKIHPKHRIPHVTTLVTGVFVALWALIGDAGETYDLTNIGTLFAFVLVCVGVVVLRHKEPRAPAAVPRSVRACHRGAGRADVRLPDVATAARDLDPVRGLAGDRHGALRRRTATGIRCCGRARKWRDDGDAGDRRRVNVGADACTADARSRLSFACASSWSKMTPNWPRSSPPACANTAFQVRRRGDVREGRALAPRWRVRPHHPRRHAAGRLGVRSLPRAARGRDRPRRS